MKKFALIAVAVASLFSASAAYAGYYVPTCGWVLGIYGPVYICY